ncbi:AAEL013339-PA [Aedes aegypti]|uniref:AAEL013339-PA n=2 Tax=Aedes aegypti TaxID=7159 RepID=A0A1S4FZ32_AEDAE|nr:protein lethal(2)essential for life [Aedes aegypti]EAT34410.1 AAEL013339-PA [Aedes aegypti]
MALVPVLLRDLFDGYLDDDLPRFRNRRSFRGGLHPEDVLLALEDAFPKRCRRKRSWHQSDLDDELQDGTVAKKSANEFKVNINVEDFEPDEISVKATDKFVTVEGKHEEKDDENRYELRHFVRRYQLPEGHDRDKIASTLSSDGVLTISAPKLALPEPEKERPIPVGKVSKPKKPSEKKAKR